MRRILFLILIVTGLFLAYNKYGYLLQSYRNLPSSTNQKKQSSDRDLSYLKLPPGFAITYFFADVPGARSLALGDNGVVYVGSRPQGAVYALQDQDNDGRADKRYLLASGLNNPNGVAYKNGDLYVAEIGRLLVFRGIDSKFANQPPYEIVYDQLPEATHHGWRYLRVGPEGKLYLGIGAPCNVCNVADPFGTLSRLNPDGTGFEIIARGVRNTVGFDWDPAGGALWFTDNGRDNLGDDAPPDELNRLGRVGDNFGFPVCHGGTLLDPQFGKAKNCADFSAPKLNLGPHVAALGLRFYRGEMFPDEYKNKVIIAEHGSWNRTTPVGYRLMTVDIKGNKADNYQEFVTGWLGENGDAKGRPVDLLELPDGSLLISDDLYGAVYRLTYSR